MLPVKKSYVAGSLSKKSRSSQQDIGNPLHGSETQSAPGMQAWAFNLHGCIVLGSFFGLLLRYIAPMKGLIKQR